MRASLAPILITLVAFSTVGPELVVAQSSSPAVARLSLAGPAKRYCSGIWVSKRERPEALYNSVLWDQALLEAYEGGSLEFAASQRARVISETRAA